MVLRSRYACTREDLVPPSDLPTLLTSLFSASELRRFVRWGPQGGRLENQLPEHGVAPAQLASHIAALYEREGMVEGLPSRLIKERPRRADDIRYVFEVRERARVEEARLQREAEVGGQGAAASPLSVPGTRPVSLTGMGFDLFLAHASPDKSRVREVYQRLAGEVRVFFDEQLPKGGTWDQSISRALHDSAVIAVLSSTETWSSALYMRTEVQAAIGLSRATHEWIKVVPVHLDGFPASGTEQLYGLSLFQGFVVDETHSLEDVTAALVALVQQVQPVHRLSQLLRHIFPDPYELATWITEVPRLDPFHPKFKVDPRQQGAAPWRQAASQLQTRGRANPLEPMLWEMLVERAPEHEGLVQLVKELY